MPTNEERKAVAARLRWLADENTVTATDYLVREIFKELGGEPPAPPSNPTLGDLEAYDQAFLYRLADLIEPEERTYEPFGIWHEISQTQEIRRRLCGYCGNELGIDKRNHFPFEVEDLCELPNFCPKCGARVKEEV